MINDKIAQLGSIKPPPAVAAIGGYAQIPTLISAIIKTFVVGAGVYAVINFILAGYAYISSAGNPQGIQAATAKIWHSAMGLAIAAGALIIAGIVGKIIFNDPNALINITIFTIN